MPYAHSNGCRIYYEQVGSLHAPPLVMLRGFARSLRYWGNAITPLAEAFRLILIDNRGVGRSQATRPPYNASQLADDVAAVLDDAALERVHLFGMSLGGMVAQRFALRHPSRLHRLVLGCTHAGGRQAVRYGRRAMWALARASFAQPQRSAELLAPYLVSASTLQAQPDLIATWAELSRREPPSATGILGQLAVAASHRTDHELPRITAPTLVVSGDQDELIPPQNSYRLTSRIPGAQLELLPGARHDFITDRPQQTATSFRRFLLG